MWRGGGAAVQRLSPRIVDNTLVLSSPPSGTGTRVPHSLVAAADVTPPVVTPTVVGTLNASGWYTSGVTVNWLVTDPDSAVTAQTGCGPTSIKGGPHGMHTIGTTWIGDHRDAIEANRADCLYCHGSTSAGSPLAVVKIAKTFVINDGRSKTFAAESRVTCWSCHNGPNP